MKALAVITAFWMAHPAQAQDLVYSNDATWNCIASTKGRLARMGCIGLSADACTLATPDGGTTFGMGGCLGRELDFWDQLLNKTYSYYLERAEAADAEGSAISSITPSLSHPLRAMQRAWLPFRDATCEYAGAQWGGGSGTGPATVRCLMRLTAEQTLALDELWMGG